MSLQSRAGNRFLSKKNKKYNVHYSKVFSINYFKGRRDRDYMV